MVFINRPTMFFGADRGIRSSATGYEVLISNNYYLACDSIVFAFDGGFV